jgi:quinol monooxygenase YgiN
MTAYSIATHPVKDFETWKTTFDQFEPVRQESGERSAVVLRHSDAPNMVSVINTWDTIETAQAFFAREDLKTGMAEGGVTAPPTVVFGNAE